MLTPTDAAALLVDNPSYRELFDSLVNLNRSAAMIEVRLPPPTTRGTRKRRARAARCNLTWLPPTPYDTPIVTFSPSASR